jgi:RHS repeat-associated protein
MTAMPHLPSMRWDYQDQLEQVDMGGGGTAYYVYDAGGQRVRKVIERNGGTLIEERLYLDGLEIFRRRTGAGTVTLERETLHIMDDQQRIALVETRTQGDDDSPVRLIRYQFGNHLGSASLELDDQAQIISYEEYYPYGSTSYQAVRNQTETPKRYRFTGMERDEESELNYHGARYYAPWLGRWVSCDPLGIIDSLSAYSYAKQNPVRLIDTRGLDSDESLIAAGWKQDVNGVWQEPNTQVIEVTGTASSAPTLESLAQQADQLEFDLAWHFHFQDQGERKRRREEERRRELREVGAYFHNVTNVTSLWAGVYLGVGLAIIGGGAFAIGGTGSGGLWSTGTYMAARGTQAIVSNAPAAIAGSLAYGLIAPPGAPDLPGIGDDVGREARTVIVDTSAVYKWKQSGTLLKSGETPVITRTVVDELARNAARGKPKMPSYASQFEVIEDAGTAAQRLAVRNAVIEPAISAGRNLERTKNNAGIQGFWGDGTIGATAMHHGLPVITSDVDLAAALQILGIEVRYVP